MKKNLPWFVYIVKCSDKTLYTGITKNITKRIEEHNTSPLGAKYTRGRRPVNLLYSQKMKNKSQALKKEWSIKRLSKNKKILLIKKEPRVQNKNEGKGTKKRKQSKKCKNENGIRT